MDLRPPRIFFIALCAWAAYFVGRLVIIDWLPVAGWPEERARMVEITGGADPVVPTPFRIGAAGAAALAATGLAAADLWELRTGRRQEVGVDLRQAVASLRSGHYMQMGGASVSTERNRVMGVYPAKNWAASR